MNDESTINLAKEYNEYMKFRAAKEKIKYELDIKFYAMHLAAGYAFFFGVYNDGNHLILDKQKPEIFKEWQKDSSSI